MADAEANATRAAFDALGVFEQDFDTAMQILMYQDEKVARLALEEPQDASARRSRRRGRRSSSSRKRRRADNWQEGRPQAPALPFGGYTTTQELTGTASGDSQWSTQRTEATGDCMRSGMLPESQFMQSTEETQELGPVSYQTQDLLSVSASVPETQVHCSESQPDTGQTKDPSDSPASVGRVPERIDILREMEVGYGVASTMPSLFQTAKGQTLTLSKAKVQAYEAKLRAEEDEEKAPAESAASVMRVADVHAAFSDLDAGAGAASTMPSLFQTAKGRTLTLSKAKVQAYEAKLRAEEDEEKAPAESAASVMRVADVHAAFSDLDAGAGAASTMPSLFQTAKGRTLTLSKAKVQAYEAKLRAEEDEEKAPAESAASVMRVADVHAAFSDLDAGAGAASTMPSLFQTAKGRTLTLSKAKVQAYEAKLRAEEDEEKAPAESAASVMRVADVHAAFSDLDAGAGAASTMPSLFQTAKGRTLTLSKAKVQAYEAKLRAEEDEEKAPAESAASVMRVADVHAAFSDLDAGAGAASTMPSLFQTAKGRTLTLSKAKVQAYEAKLRAEEDEEKAPAESAASVMRVADVHAAFSDLDAGAGAASTMPSLFQTAKGRTLTLSKAKVQAYEAKLRAEEDEEKAPAESAASVMRVADVHAAFSDLDAGAGAASTMPSLFQTAKGRTLTLSKAKVQAYEAKLRAEEDEEKAPAESAASVMRVADVHAAFSDLDAGAGAASTMPSLFQTAKGRTLTLSKAKVQAYEAKLRAEEDEEKAPAESAASVMRVADVHAAFSDLDAGAGAASTMPSLFQTAKGRTLTLSKAKVQAYEAKLRAEEDEEKAPAESAASVMRVADVHAAFSDLDAGAGAASTMPSLFQTAKGRTLTLSKAKVQAYEAKLRAEEDEEKAPAESAASVMRVADVHAAFSDLDAGAGAASTMPSLFQTAKGRTLTLSKAKVQAYEAKLRAEEDEEKAPAESAASVMRVADVHAAFSDLDAGAGAASTMPSLFQTAKGRTLTLSKAKVQAYEAKLRAEEDEEKAPAESAASVMRVADVHAAFSDLDAGAGAASTMPSLFQTAKGRTLTLSKAKVQAYEAKLRAEEDEEKAPAESAASVMRVADVHAAFSDLDAGAGAASTMPSLFQTAKGRTLTLSKAKVQAYEAKLRAEEDEEKAPAESAASVMRVADVHAAFSDLDAGAGAASTMPSLFQTAKGRTLTLSKAKVQAYEAKLRAEEDEEKAPAESAASVMRVADVQASFSDHDAGGDADSSGIASEITISDGLEPRRNLLNWALQPTRDAAIVQNAALNERPRSLRAPRRKIRQDRSIGSTNGFAPPRLRQVRELEGDKENVHPENRLVRQTAVLEASKSWQSSLSTRLASTSKEKYPHHQFVHKQPLTDKWPGRPLTGPSQARSGRKRFHPPVASKKQPTNASKEYRYHAGPKSKKQKVSGEKARPFNYREAMKISLTHLTGLHKDHGDETSDLPRIEVLNAITAINAVDVLFARNDCTVVVHRDINGSYDPAVFAGPHELYCQLIAGNHILKNMGATFEWFLNHYRWIVWKLAAMERSFPLFLLEKYLTKDQVLHQISHRYQRDLNNAQRSVLKKILNRDASSLSCMVLCIAAVLPFPIGKDQPIDQELPPCWNMALVLTDGWYSVYAVPDAPLAAVLWKLHEKTSIVGTKIATWNASLQNSTEGIDPLECAVVRDPQWKNPLLTKEDMAQWPYMQLRYNSTRRVAFDTQLGLEKRHYTIPVQTQTRKQEPQLTFSLLKSIPLKSLEVGGGMVRSVRVKVKRISPVLHLQSKEWTLGPRILCEEQLQMYFQLRSEYSRLARNKRHKQDCREDDFFTDGDVGDDQLGVPLPMPFIKLDVECTHTATHERSGMGCGILTIWRPSEDLLSGGLKEGAEYFASSLTVNWKIDGGRGQDAFLRLSSTKHTGFEKVSEKQPSVENGSKSTDSLHGSPRACVDIQQATMDYRANYENGLVRNERRATIDVCVCVVVVAAREALESTAAVTRQAQTSMLDPAIKPKESRFVEHIFVTDRSQHLMSIRVSEMEISMAKMNDTKTSKWRLSSSFVFRRGSKNTWKEGTIVCLSGLEISHYDEQLRVLDCVMVESTQILSFPSKKSPFWDAFHLLQDELKVHTPRGYSTPELGSSSFAIDTAQLKKYVERDVLLLDFVATQDHDQHQVEVVEQERLTQDLQTHEEESVKDPNDQAVDVATTPSHNHLRWDGTVVKVLPLPGASRLLFPRDVIAFACVSMRTDAKVFRTVYLFRETVATLRSLLRGAGNPCSDNDNNLPADTDATLVQSATQTLSALTAQQGQLGSGQVFRFEVRQSTNERLINSWKPWERLHASYWMALSVTALPQ